MRVFLEEVSIWIGRLNKENYSLQWRWASSNPLWDSQEQKGGRWICAAWDETFLHSRPKDILASGSRTFWLRLQLTPLSPLVLKAVGWIETKPSPFLGLQLAHDRFGISLVVQSVKNPPEMQETAWNAGDLGLIPGWERSPGEENANPLQYSCLENPMDRGVW